MQDLLARERQRAEEDRINMRTECDQIRKAAAERTAAEVARVKSEEDTRRRIMTKKHAVTNPC
jgi:hypothetical protein